MCIIHIMLYAKRVTLLIDKICKEIFDRRANTEKTLSSPRAKRAGPKGLRSESARAVTVQ